MHHLSFTLDAGDVLYLLDIIPVASYSNADIQKLDILRDNKNKSGIYRLTNLLTGKYYIGRSINLGRRLRRLF